MLSGIKNLFTRPKEQFIFEPVSQELLNSWNENGFLILKDFFSQEELKTYEDEINSLIENRRTEAGQITIDLLEGEYIGQRMRLKDTPDEALDYAYKINDLFLDSPACRSLNLNVRLCKILGGLLQGKPIIINSLTFKKGSQQPLHFDTYFMPPPVQDKMVVSSICLEDQSPDSGTLTYYPGSHKIPPYIFSHGAPHSVPEEMEKATEYTMSEIEARSLEAETFLGKAGDVFIWHAQLYHGGLPITDPTKTRKTLVTHYWRESDMSNYKIADYSPSGSYIIRDHQDA